MHGLVVGDEQLTQELFSHPHHEHVSLTLTSDLPPGPLHQPTEFLLDLSFENRKERIARINTLHIPVVFVNSVADTLEEIGQSFVRINGWPGFVGKAVWEGSAKGNSLREKSGDVLNALGRKMEWVPDIIGFITPRIVASIVNEAYFALGEEISTREEIDTAMKLGTNYPFGPFEWSEKIGLGRIHDLLNKLSLNQDRYCPSALLVKSALA